MPGLVIVAAVINWLVSTIFTESHLFKPVRDWIVNEAYAIRTPEGVKHIGNKHFYLWPEDATQEQVDAANSNIILHGRWTKPAQLVICQLCTRVWVGFAEAAYFGGPDHGWARLIANGLLFAGAGHLIYEARSRIALVVPVSSVSEND